MNLLPYYVYVQLGLGELKPTSITLQLADRSVKVPRGIIEDVLIKVDKFYYPVDFIVLDTEPVIYMEIQIQVILGRPFLTTANALINCRTRVMKLSFGNMTVELNIFDINRQPLDYEEGSNACAIEEIVEETVNEPSVEDQLGACLTAFEGDMDLDTLLEQADALLDSTPKSETDTEENTETSSPDPSTAKPAKQELKPLPTMLKYKYLRPAKSLLVIIPADLNEAQEQKLMDVLREHKKP
jgi:hypothetical protein